MGSIDIGTSWTFSRRFVAVTTTSFNPEPGEAAAGSLADGSSAAPAAPAVAAAIAAALSLLVSSAAVAPDGYDRAADKARARAAPVAEIRIVPPSQFDHAVGL